MIYATGYLIAQVRTEFFFSTSKSSLKNYCKLNTLINVAM